MNGRKLMCKVITVRMDESAYRILKAYAECRDWTLGHAARYLLCFGLRSYLSNDVIPSPSDQEVPE